MQLQVKAKVKAWQQGVCTPSPTIAWQNSSWGDLSHVSSSSSPARLLCRCFAGTKGTALQRASCPLKPKASQEENPFPTLPSDQAGKAGRLVKAGAFPGANCCFEERPCGLAQQSLPGAPYRDQPHCCFPLHPPTCIPPPHCRPPLPQPISQGQRSREVLRCLQGPIQAP